MAKNIEMQYYNGSTYDICYPLVNLSNVTGTLDISKVSGILPISQGGTGYTNIDDFKSSLGYLSLSGGTMNGNLILNGNPTLDLQAVPKQYVDAKVGAITGYSYTISLDYSSYSSGSYGWSPSASYTFNLGFDISYITINTNWYMSFQGSDRDGTSQGMSGTITVDNVELHNTTSKSYQYTNDGSDGSNWNVTAKFTLSSNVLTVTVTPYNVYFNRNYYWNSGKTPSISGKAFA